MELYTDQETLTRKTYLLPIHPHKTRLLSLDPSPIVKWTPKIGFPYICLVPTLPKSLHTLDKFSLFTLPATHTPPTPHIFSANTFSAQHFSFLP